MTTQEVAAPRSASPAGARGGVREILCCLVPLVFAVPVLAAISVTTGRLIAARDVWINYGSAINGDAVAMFLGQWPYRDPASGYFAQGYTPLFAMVVSLLHHIHYWRGWGPLVTIVSSLALIPFGAKLAYRRGAAARWLYVVEALGVGALAWSIMDIFDAPNLYGGRVDQFAWALAFGGLLLLPAALKGSRGAGIAMVALLSLAFWAKQTTLIVPAAIVVALLITRRGTPPWRRVAKVTAIALAVNGALLAALALATDGWQLRYDFGIQLPVAFGVGHGARLLLEHTAAALCFLAVICAAAAWAGRRPRLGAREADPLTLALVLATLFGAASGIWLRRFIGGADNDFLGALWALALLTAVAYRHARASGRAAPVVAAAMIALAMTTVVGGAWTLRNGELVPTQTWPSLPRDFVAYTRDHVVYDPLAGDLNLPSHRVVFPHQVNIVELLERGDQPRWFVDQLLHRRFDAVYGLFGPDFDTELALSKQAEDNYFWKLNLLIEAGYVGSRKAPPEPAGAAFGNGTQPLYPRVRRRGAGPMPWIGSCFGSLRAAGLKFEIGPGGGLWCGQAGSDVIRLRDAPVPVAQVESSRPLESLAGTLRVTLAARPGARWEARIGDGWRASAVARRDLSGADVAITAPSGTVHRFVSRRALRRSQGAVEIPLPGALARPAPLVLRASADSDASFSFGRVTAR